MCDVSDERDAARYRSSWQHFLLTGTRRTVLMLAGCQALSMTGGSIVGLTGAIVGNMLTPDKALSTLPIAVQQAGVMAATIPAALLMARIGRRPGFWLGTAIGGVGAVIATWAIFRSSFEWFCFGTFLLGANRGATQQYRFAAAEIADEAFRSKAISLVLAGGVVSAVFGAEVAKWSRDLFEPVLFAGCYALILVLFLASAVLLYFVELPRPAILVLAGGGRPLREIAMEPSFIAAAVAGMIAYGVMSLVMTATPIAMLDCGHEFAAAAFVIQWHSLGMFAPSFVTGHLITRLGLTRIMLTGAVLLLLCSLINLSGLATFNFWAANVALAGGTSVGLLTDVHGRVIHHRRRPIAGLYASGTVAAATEQGIGYQAGLSLASAMTFSYLAVRHMIDGP